MFRQLDFLETSWDYMRNQVQVLPNTGLVFGNKRNSVRTSQPFQPRIRRNPIDPRHVPKHLLKNHTSIY